MVNFSSLCKKRRIIYGDGSFLALWKEIFLALSDGLPMLLRRCQKIHKGKLNLKITERLKKVKNRKTVHTLFQSINKTHVVCPQCKLKVLDSYRDTARVELYSVDICWDYQYAVESWSCNCDHYWKSIHIYDAKKKQYIHKKEDAACLVTLLLLIFFYNV